MGGEVEVVWLSWGSRRKWKLLEGGRCVVGETQVGREGSRSLGVERWELFVEGGVDVDLRRRLRRRRRKGEVGLGLGGRFSDGDELEEREDVRSVKNDRIEGREKMAGSVFFFW